MVSHLCGRLALCVLVGTFLFALAFPHSTPLAAAALPPEPPVKLPFQVKNIRPDPTVPMESAPYNFIEMGGIAYFAAHDGAHGFELWRSDGTEAGTWLVKDIAPGPAYSLVGEPWVVLNGLILTGANDGTHGFELWRSDGTEAGTVMIEDLNPGGANGVWTAQMVVYQGWLYFAADPDNNATYTLHRTDGYTIEEVANVVAADWEVAGDTLFFIGSSDVYPCMALWRYDGSSAAPILVEQQGATGPLCSPYDLTAVGGTLYLWMYTWPWELWKSDGTNSGTIKVAELTTEIPYGLTDIGGTLYFGTRNFDNQRVELWKSTGIAAGTTRVKQFNQAGGNALISNLIEWQGALHFLLHDEGGLARWLYRSDGTGTGTTLVAEFGDEGASGDPKQLLAAGGQLYFGTRHDVTGMTTLWQSDGTPGGTRVVHRRGSSTAPHRLARVGDWLFFAWEEPWVWHLTSRPPSDLALPATIGTHLPVGTPVGTIQVTDPDVGDTHRITFVSGEGDTHNSLFAIEGNTLKTATIFYDEADLDSFTIRLRADDGKGGSVTEALTITALPQGNPLPDLYLVKEAFPNSAGFDEAPRLVGGAGTHFFYEGSDNRSTALWASDGTAAGTTRLLAGDVVESSGFAAIGNVAYFALAQQGSGTELWRSDGTTMGTRLVKEIAAGSASAAPRWQTALNGMLYFGATSSGDTHLWKSDGTAAGTTPLLTREVRGPFAVVGDTLYFTVVDGQSYQLWRSDGTAGGTGMVKSFANQPIAELTAAGDLLYFYTRHPSTMAPLTLYRTDGTVAGTHVLSDVAPSLLTPSGGSLYFRANGNQLWRSDGAMTNTRSIATIGSAIHKIEAGAGRLFVAAGGEGGSSALWASDGSSAGTHQLPGNGPADQQLVTVGRYAFFTRDEPGVAGLELWQSDGTVAGTVRVADLAPGPQSSAPGELLGWNNSLFFGADTIVTGRELWGLRLSESGTVDNTGGTLSLGPSLTLEIPAGLLPAATTFHFAPLLDPSDGAPQGYRPAGSYFTLEATRDGQPVADPFGGGPATLSLSLDPALSEREAARLFYYDPQAAVWLDAAQGCSPPSPYVRDDDGFSVNICHLTEFALFMPAASAPPLRHHLLLPLVRK